MKKNPNKNETLTIGLTGGIGSGKSLATEYLRSLGYPVIDADQVARQLVEPGRPLLEEIFDDFLEEGRARGLEIRNPDGSLNRKQMAALVFTDQELLAEYETIIGQAILEEIQAQSDALRASGKYSIIFIDAALLFESGLMDSCDASWVVDAEDEVRISRVMARDGATREQVLDRMRAQMSRLDRLRLGDVTLLNDSSPEELYQQIDRNIGELKNI